MSTQSTRIRLLLRGLASAQPPAVRLRRQTGFGLAELKRFVPNKSESLGNGGGPQRQDGSAVDQNVQSVSLGHTEPRTEFCSRSAISHPW